MCETSLKAYQNIAKLAAMLNEVALAEWGFWIVKLF